MKNIKILVFLLILSNNLFMPANADVKDYATLKEANETPGDRVYNVSTGTEYLDSSLIQMAPGTLTVQGSGENSVLSGQLQSDPTQNGNFFKLRAGDNTLNLNDFTIQEAVKTNAEGSVILLFAGNTANLHNMIIQDNQTTNNNGGAIASTNATLNIFDSKFLNNQSATSSGAIVIRGADSNTVIDNTLFEGNNAYLTGAMFIDRGNLQLTNSVFRGNFSTTTTQDGGNPGALRLGTGDSISFIENCIFENNRSGHNAGAVYSYGNTVIKDTQFTGNYASFRGGALINGTGGNTTITGSSFDNNSSSETAGAIYNDGTLNIDTTTITNNTANHHTPTSADGNGGGIYNSSLGVLNVNQGTIVQNNTAAGYGGGIANSVRGVITVNGAVIDSNTSQKNGGGIWNNGTAAVTGGTSITNNTASGNGGGIFNSGVLDLTSDENGNIIFQNNTAGGTANDIYTNNRVNINGESGIVSVSGGITGSGAINKFNDGIFILQGDNSNYIGDFNQSGGTTAVTNGKWFGGNSTIEDGTLEWGEGAEKVSGKLVVHGGNLLVDPNAILDLNNPDDTIAADANIYLSESAVINNSGTVTFNPNDNWEGTVNNTGSLTLDNFIKNSGNLNQTDGYLALHHGSQLSTDNGTTITGGDLQLDGKSILNVTDNNFTVNDLLMNDSTINALNGMTMTNYINNNFVLGPEGAHFNIDFDGDTRESDQFVVNGQFVGTGPISVDDYWVAGAPTDVRIDFPVFTGSNVDSVIFTAVDKEVQTPIYNYKLVSAGGGVYSLVRQEFNPSVYRGVQSVESVFLNNLLVTNMIFEHVYIDSEELTYLRSQKDTSNIFYAPYQQTDNQEGSVWYKPYVSYDRFSLTNNNDVYNTAYGSIIGFDFPTEKINDEWEFLPTAFITYQGARQSANGGDFYQNGGMGGFMGTFFHGETISSIMAYAGGYGNEMQYQGYNDTTGNWYAGCAAIAAHNFHPKANIIIQPIVWGAYNILGKQTWTADYGSVPMATGYLNGLAFAPGINAFYGKDDWSVYGTISYLFTVNDHVTASAGAAVLDDATLRYGFLQYGVGFIKKFKDRFLAYGQVTIRNGGLTGVAFWGGLSYRF